MRTEPNRRLTSVKLVLIAAVTLLLLGTVWFVRSVSASSAEVRKLGENVTSAVNAKDFTRLEQLLGNPVAVATIRSEAGSGNESVRLGHVSASNNGTRYFSIIISATPEKEIFVYLSKDESDF